MRVYNGQIFNKIKLALVRVLFFSKIFESTIILSYESRECYMWVEKGNIRDLIGSCSSIDWIWRLYYLINCEKNVIHEEREVKIKNYPMILSRFNGIPIRWRMKIPRKEVECYEWENPCRKIGDTSTSKSYFSTTMAFISRPVV